MFRDVRRKVQTYMDRIALLQPNGGPRHHVKLVDLGTSHEARYLYAHNNNPACQIDTLIGRIPRGAEGDRVWEVLCECSRRVREDGAEWPAVARALWAGQIPQRSLTRHDAGG